MMVDYVHLLMFLVFVLVHLPNKCALSTNHGHGAACVSLDAFFTLSKLKKGCSADSGLRILWTLDALPQVQTSKNQMPVYTVCVCVCSLLLGFSSRWKTFPFWQHHCSKLSSSYSKCSLYFHHSNDSGSLFSSMRHSVSWCLPLFQLYLRGRLLETHFFHPLQDPYRARSNFNTMLGSMIWWMLTGHWQIWSPLVNKMPHRVRATQTGALYIFEKRGFLVCLTHNEVKPELRM